MVKITELRKMYIATYNKEPTLNELLVFSKELDAIAKEPKDPAHHKGV